MFSLSVDWMGFILPVAYLIVLGGTFVTFSSIYRRRKATQSANLSPWFPPHLQRNVYLSLMHMEPETGKSTEKAPKVPDSVLRAALLRRAVEDIRRIYQIRTGKQACQSLLQRGSVGDDLWQRFLRAEHEMEDELRDVVMEANALVPNWGQIIFQTANAIAGNEALRARLDTIQAQMPAEKAWWEKRRASIERGLLAEDGHDKVAADAESSSKGLASPTAASKTSDDDAVLVDAAAAKAPVPAPSTTSTPSGKRKKGKK